MPIDSEKILETKFGIYVVPDSGVEKLLNVDSFMTGDFKEIHIDYDIYMDERFYRRSNYSLAHEIGHLILHKDVYKNITYTNPYEWKEIIKDIPDSEYNWLETHAYEFAGRFLVPLDVLEKDFKLIEKDYQKFIQQFPDYDKVTIAEHLARNIKTDFGVTEKVIAKRLIKEGLIA